MRAHDTVLIVDDDEGIRDVLLEIFEGEGFDVRCCRNGLEALEWLRDQSASVILLDLMMPVMNGWAFLERRKQDARLAAIPVVVISADEACAEAIGSFDVVGCLTKPFQLEALLGAVSASGSTLRKSLPKPRHA
jgi:two-component system, chemotaxis family, chemotaxis protein CheY